MNTKAVTVSALLALVLPAGCGETDAASPGMCVSVVKYQGSIYEAWASTTEAMSPVGNARRGVCSDVETPGISFPDDAETVEVGSFDGFDPLEVVGTEADNGRTTFYIAQDVSDSRVEELARQLKG